MQKKESLIKKWHKLNNKALKLLADHNSFKDYNDVRLKMDDIEETLWNDYCYDINNLVNNLVDEKIWVDEILDTFK